MHGAVPGSFLRAVAPPKPQDGDPARRPRSSPPPSAPHLPPPASHHPLSPRHARRAACWRRGGRRAATRGRLGHEGCSGSHSAWPQRQRASETHPHFRRQRKPSRHRGRG
eukprot:365181-Chlamydomonas_euryale.AAC.1